MHNGDHPYLSCYVYCAASTRSTSHEICTRLALCCVLLQLGIGQFYPYYSQLGTTLHARHLHWGNSIVVTIEATSKTMCTFFTSYESTMSWWCIEAETKWWPFRRRHANRIFLNESVRTSIEISLKFVPNVVQIMAWHRPGDKPLSEPMMIRLPTYMRHSVSIS